MKTLEQKFLDAFKSQYKNDFEYNEYPNEHIRLWFMNGYELAKKELEEQIKEARRVIDFYANQWEQDQSIYGGYGIYMTSLKNDTEEISKNTRSYGKKARAYLEKWK